MSSIPAYKMLIDGQAVAGEAHFDVVNPATEQVVGRAPDISRVQLDTAIDAARRGYAAWKSTPIVERQAKVAAMGALIASHMDELSRLLTAEQGKPLDRAVEDVGGAPHFCTLAAQLTPPVEVHEDSTVRFSATYRVPLGVVCAISPWNFPVADAFLKIAAALVAGNAVVLKPSPFTPLTTLRIGELVQDALPPGVLNIISGGDQLGPWLTSHPGIDQISFTGSTATGRRVMESAAPTLKRLTLELGGNDAAIVLPGIDIHKTAERVFEAAFNNSGQVCFAAKRVYVHADVYQPFAEALVELGRTAVIGDGAEQGVTFGPIQNRQQYDRIQDLIADSRASGHAFLLGGKTPLPERGYFIAPTILDNPPENSRIVQEEQFGPVLPLLRFDDVDAAIELANASVYGLGGSVWGPPEQAEAVARQLDTGMVWVNEFGSLAPSQPFGGRKQSGYGVENGIGGYLEFTSPHTIVTARNGLNA